MAEKAVTVETAGDVEKSDFRGRVGQEIVRPGTQGPREGEGAVKEAAEVVDGEEGQLSLRL